MSSSKEDNCPRITDLFLKKLLSSDIRMYYNTRSLNDKLYIHYKGFRKIENLADFTCLKVLYIEGNALDSLDGLQNNTELRCLYVQENCISRISDIENLVNLYTINLSDNLLTSVSNLDYKPKLETLLLQRNNIGRNGPEDLIEVLKLENLSVLDISHNKIEDPEVLTEVLYKMPKLSVLYLQGNPVCKKIQNYRKELIVNLPNLKYLDDRPVFPEDRRYAEAFKRGGVQEEREERKRVDREKEEERMRNHIAFREMIERSRKEREEVKSNESTTSGSEIETNSGSQMWTSSVESENDPPECNTPNSLEILIPEEELKNLEKIEMEIKELAKDNKEDLGEIAQDNGVVVSKEIINYDDVE